MIGGAGLRAAILMAGVWAVCASSATAWGQGGAVAPDRAVARDAAAATAPLPRAKPGTATETAHPMMLAAATAPPPPDDRPAAEPAAPAAALPVPDEVPAVSEPPPPRPARAGRLLPVSAVAAIPDVPPRTFDRGRAPAAAARVLPRLEGWLRVKGLAVGAPVYLRIFKESRELELWVQGPEGAFALFQTYPICAVSGTLGPKEHAGDEQAPEGFYMVTPNQLNPNSDYHLAMNVGYPNPHDRTLGRSGGLIMIHGQCVSRGCFAMTNRLIEDVYALVEAALKQGQRGVPVHIFPFRMTEENFKRHRTSRWLGFWRGLKPAADVFERTKRPPAVVLDTSTGRYVFEPG